MLCSVCKCISLIYSVPIGSFRYIKINLIMRLRGHKQTKLIDHVNFIHFCCLCPLDFDVELNFNILKGAF